MDFLPHLINDFPDFIIINKKETWEINQIIATKQSQNWLIHKVV